MKSLVINLLAGWVGTVRSFIDGDIFRETNIDLSMGDVADRLGYLKTKADGSVQLATANAITGNNTHAGTETFNGQATFNSTSSFNDDASFNSSVDVSATLNSNTLAQFQGELRLVGAFANLNGVVRFVPETLANADSVIGANTFFARVPQITVNRIYTLPAAIGDGQIVVLSRVRTADAFSVTLNTPAAVTVGVIPASQAGWLVAEYQGGVWKALLFSSNITSILATV